MTPTDLTDPLATIISSFRRRHVLILGDAILDEYVVGDCTRISPEAPVPVLQIKNSRQVLGGAANTAANIVSLGGRATLITLAGSDSGGVTLRRCAAEAGIDLHALDHGFATLRKTRVVAHQQQIVRLDYEEGSASSAQVQSEILNAFDACLETCDIVVISDYAKGFLSPALAHAVIQRAHNAGRQVIVDPRPQNRDCYLDCDYLTPNWRESRALLGLPDGPASPAEVHNVAQSLSKELNTNVVLTLGPQGMSFFSRDGAEQFAVSTMAREVFDVSGAGDTVVAAFSLALAAGATHPAAIEIANRAASVVVGKFGTATVTPEEILLDAKTLRLVPRHALGQLASTLRAKGKRIVTINGSFDILHSGHLYILDEARQQGDVLIVGLNSDASVKTYKGPDRPIVPESDRAEMLLALRMVDYVHIFDETDPIAFLKAIQPDVHVNGAEYGENCIESDTVKRGGGRVHIVGRLPGLSTSRLVVSLQTASVAG